MSRLLGAWTTEFATSELQMNFHWKINLSLCHSETNKYFVGTFFLDRTVTLVRQTIKLSGERLFSMYRSHIAQCDHQGRFGVPLLFLDQKMRLSWFWFSLIQRLVCSNPWTLGSVKHFRWRSCGQERWFLGFISFSGIDHFGSARNRHCYFRSPSKVTTVALESSRELFSLRHESRCIYVDMI